MKEEIKTAFASSTLSNNAKLRRKQNTAKSRRKEGRKEGKKKEMKKEGRKICFRIIFFVCFCKHFLFRVGKFGTRILSMHFLSS